MKKLIGIACVFLLMSCGNSNNQIESNSKNLKEPEKTNKSYSDILDNPVEIPEAGTNISFHSGNYERYIIVKGATLNSSMAKVQDYGQSFTQYSKSLFKLYTSACQRQILF